MNYLAGEHLHTKKGEHRLHPTLTTICIMFASVATALYAKAGKDVHSWPPDAAVTVACAQFDLAIHMPLVGPLESVLRGVEPEEIKLLLSFKSASRGVVDIKNLLTKAIVPSFVEFFEDGRLWLDTYASGSFIRWPDVWQFGRIVRNAAPHNLISIDDPKFTPVKWYGLTYGPEQNGRSIFDADLTLADVLILMFEMNDSLDQLGCPI